MSYFVVVRLEWLVTTRLLSFPGVQSCAPLGYTIIVILHASCVQYHCWWIDLLWLVVDLHHYCVQVMLWTCNFIVFKLYVSCLMLITFGNAVEHLSTGDWFALSPETTPTAPQYMGDACGIIFNGDYDLERLKDFENFVSQVKQFFENVMLVFQSWWKHLVTLLGSSYAFTAIPGSYLILEEQNHYLRSVLTSYHFALSLHKINTYTYI